MDRGATPPHDVVAALFVRAGTVLLCHRHPGRRWYPDCWDLPGGHVEAGETAHDALVRECREELGVTVLETRPVAVEVLDPAVVLRVLAVAAWSGEPLNRAPEEHDAIAWCDATGLAGARLADERLRRLLLDAARAGIPEA